MSAAPRVFGAPNVFSTIYLPDASYTVTSGQAFYSTSVQWMFLSDYTTAFYSFTNEGTLWARNAGETEILHVSQRDITNHGLITAQSISGAARTITFSNSPSGLYNDGAILAVAPNSFAGAVKNDSSSVVANDGLIAAKGVTAYTVWFTNAGQVLNGASGQILAEGRNAVGVILGRGQSTSTTVSVDNDGLIKATSTGPYASVAVLYQSLSSETVRIENSGSLIGEYAVYAQDYAFSPPQRSKDMLVNEATGNIQGAIYLGMGDDVLQNAGNIIGYIDMDEGDDLVDTSVGSIDGVIYLGTGQDSFIGGAGQDVVVAERGDDNLLGGDCADLLLAGRGNDTLNGGAGNDGLYGEFGNDLIVTQAGDKAYGGVGEDIVQAGDLEFAFADGGAGHDVFVVPNNVLTLGLGNIVSSGRVVNFEQIALLGAQTLVIEPSDVAAFTSGARLYVSGVNASELDLVGAWSPMGNQAYNGVTYAVYDAGGVQVWVAGVGTVQVLATNPGGTTGLDAIAAGSVAPSVGVLVGATLTDSITNFSGRFISPGIIEADEYLASNKDGWIDAGTGLINRGRIVINTTQTATGIQGTGANTPHDAIIFNDGGITNEGSLVVNVRGTLTDLRANKVQLANAGILAESSAEATGVYRRDPGDFLNAGTVNAYSNAGRAIGYYDERSGPAQNDGVLSARSPNFTAIGVYSYNCGDFVNTGSIVADGGVGAIGFAAKNGAVHIENSGVISATDRNAASNSVGVYLGEYSFSATLINSGTISAEIAVQSKLHNPADVYIENSGLIRGSIILLDPAPQKDVIYNHGVIIGGVNMGGATDIYHGADGDLRGYVFGGDGSDFILGGNRAERLMGGNGSDILLGGLGADILEGGAGRDIFAYTSKLDSIAGAIDTIVAFETGIDKLNLSALAPSQVLLRASGGDTLVQAKTASGWMTILVDGKIVLSDIVTTSRAEITGTNGDDALYASVSGSFLRGFGGADVLIGGAGSDTLAGGRGNDFLHGGGGNDYYLLNDDILINNVRVLELANQGTDTVIATLPVGFGYELPDNIENLTLASGGLAIGNALANQIIGNAAPNEITGNAGADRLTGGGGADKFIFDAVRSSAQSDLITDFDVSQDSIVLNAHAFSAISTNMGWALQASEFRFNANSDAALDGDDRIIYNAQTGDLFYDADGSAAGASVRIATLSAGLALSQADFMVLL